MCQYKIMPNHCAELLYWWRHRYYYVQVHQQISLDGGEGEEKNMNNYPSDLAWDHTSWSLVKHKLGFIWKKCIFFVAIKSYDKSSIWNMYEICRLFRMNSYCLRKNYLTAGLKSFLQNNDMKMADLHDSTVTNNW